MKFKKTILSILSALFFVALVPGFGPFEGPSPRFDYSQYEYQDDVIRAKKYRERAIFDWFFVGFVISFASLVAVFAYEEKLLN